MRGTFMVLLEVREFLVGGRGKKCAGEVGNVGRGIWKVQMTDKRGADPSIGAI